MYLPEAFRLTDRDRIAEVMRTYDFALLVTAPPTVSGGRAQASHLPFLSEPPKALPARGRRARSTATWPAPTRSRRTSAACLRRGRPRWGVCRWLNDRRTRA